MTGGWPTGSVGLPGAADPSVATGRSDLSVVTGWGDPPAVPGGADPPGPLPLHRQAQALGARFVMP